jgi:hypothetical protein
VKLATRPTKAVPACRQNHWAGPRHLLASNNQWGWGRSDRDLEVKPGTWRHTVIDALALAGMALAGDLVLEVGQH